LLVQIEVKFQDVDSVVAAKADNPRQGFSSAVYFHSRPSAAGNG
jgi:hypothetical protein